VALVIHRHADQAIHRRRTKRRDKDLDWRRPSSRFR